MFGTLPANPANHTYVFKNNGNVNIPYVRADIKISDNLKVISVYSEKFIQLNDLEASEGYFKYEIDNAMSFDNDNAFEIPLLAKDIAPEEYLECKLNFTNYTGLSVNSAVNLECLSQNDFIERFDSNILNLRNYVLTNSEKFSTDLIISAYDYDKFKAIAYRNAIEMGVLSEDYATNGNPVNIVPEDLEVWWEYSPDINTAIATDIAYGYGDIEQAIDYYSETLIDTLNRKVLFALGSFLPNDLDTTEPMLICDEIVGSFDPNDISGTPGYGDDHYVKNDNWLNYNIQFENDANQATAPASIVNIKQKLSENVDPRNFRIQDFGFGKYQFEVEENTAYYTERLDLRDSLGVYVDFVAGLDIWTNEIFFEYKTIDPQTGSVPVDANSGFLAINDSLGSGQGYVNYKILPKEECVTGDSITAMAKIVFDSNAPINTPEWLNVIDAGRPVSRVDSLENYREHEMFNVYWSGEDDSLGCGIRNYSIYVSMNEGPFEIWIENTTDTLSVFTGNISNKYEFYSIATDNVGYRELDKNEGEGVVVGNIIPEIVNLNDISFPEDTTYELDLNSIIIDDDPSTVTWKIRKTISTPDGTDSLYVIVDNNLKTTTFMATPNYVIDNVPFEFTATDNGGLTAIDTVLVTVSPVNDAPVVSLQIPDLERDEDFVEFTIDLNNHFSDVDNSVLTYIVANNSAEVTSSIKDNILTLSSVLNWSGSADISVTANDLVSKLSVNDSFRLIVSPVNDAPVVSTPLADITKDEDFTEFTIDLNGNFSDIDTSTLIFTVTNDNNQVNCVITDNILTINSVLNWNGDANISVTASDDISKDVKNTKTSSRISSLRRDVEIIEDDSRSVCIDSFILTVNPVNDVPEISTPLADITKDEDFAEFTIDLNTHFSDLDGDALYYSVANNSTQVTCEIVGNILTVGSVLNWNGVTSVTITANDRVNKLSVTDAFDITVTPVNDAPIVSLELADIVRDEDFVEFTIDLNEHFSDIDTAVLTYTVANESNKVNCVIIDNVITINSVLNWNGVADIAITANDGEYTANSAFDITVNPVNDVPEISTPLADVTVDEDFAAFTIDLNTHFSDLDGDALYYSVANNGAEVKCNIVGNILTVGSILNWNGKSPVTITANDRVNKLSVTDAFDITVNAVNDAPVVSLELADLVRDEDFVEFTIDLNEHFSDIDTSVLTYTVENNTSEVNAVITDNILTINSVLNWNGVANVSVTASDNEYTANSNFDITVNPVNDVPEISTPLADLTKDEDFTEFTIDLNTHFSDLDGDALSYSVANNGAEVTCKIVDNILTIGSILNWNGVTPVTITANDRVNKLSVTDAFDITVNAVNDAPVVTLELADLVRDEDFVEFTIDLNNHFSDIDTAVLTYTVANDVNEVNAVITDNVLTINSVLNWNGVANISVTAADGEYTANSSFAITVNPVNDVPEISTPLADITKDEDFAAFAIDLNEHFTDLDGDVLYYSVANNGTEVTSSIAGNILTVGSILNWNGVTPVTITANDRVNKLSVTDTFDITVNAVNDAPVVTLELADVIRDEDFAEFTIDLNEHFSDIDTAILTYTVANESNEVNCVITDNILTINSVLNCNGVANVSVTASDNEYTANSNFDITVNPVNDVPEISTPLADITKDEDFAEFTIDLNTHFTDLDGDALYYSVANNGAEVTCSIADNILTVGSILNWNGQSSVTITANDRVNKLSVTDAFDITVTPVNDAPIVSLELADITVDEDFAEFTIDLNEHFSDIDTAILTYTVANESNEVNATIIDNVLTINSVLNWNGVANVSVTAGDGEYTANSAFAITVNPVNDVPEIATPLADITKDEDFTEFTIDLNEHFSDLDGDALYYSVANNNAEVTCKIVGNILTVGSILDWNGVSPVTITANDRVNKLSVTDAFDITVIPVNDAPIVSLELADLVRDEDFVEFTIDLNEHFSDVDTSTLNYTVANDANEVNCVITDNVLTINSVLNWNGVANVSVTTNDGEYTANSNFSITVNPVNDAPIITLPEYIEFLSNEKVKLNLSDYIIDIDNSIDELTLSWVGNTGIVLNRIDSILVISAATPETYCREAITVTVNDLSESDSQTITIRCAPEFDAPNIKKLIGNSVKVFQDMRLHLQVWERTGMGHVDAEYTVNGVTETIRMECLNELEQSGYTYPDSCGLKLYQYVADIPAQHITSVGRVRFHLEDIAENTGISTYYLITWQLPTENFKFVEGFEGDVFGEDEWISSETDNDSLSWKTDIKPYTGEFCVASYDSSNIGENYLISPEIKFAPNKGFRVSFRAQGYNSRLRLMVSTTTNELSSFTDVVYDEVINSDFEEVIVDLSEYSKEDVYLAWVHSGDTDNESMIKIDDVIVIEYLDKSKGGDNTVETTTLYQNYPNPFNNTTMITFDLANAGNVVVNVYNYQGQLVKTVVNSYFAQGRHRVEWDGNSANGEGVSSGMYFYHMRTDGYNKIMKMMFVK
jgi:hypothetical protein